MVLLVLCLPLAELFLRTKSLRTALIVFKLDKRYAHLILPPIFEIIFVPPDISASHAKDKGIRIRPADIGGMAVSAVGPEYHPGGVVITAPHVQAINIIFPTLILDQDGRQPPARPGQRFQDFAFHL